jgi:UDP-N-acetylmuramyl pentapeptide phosphotransferase/UDP-N-acetylglucosamine-1-phosphate transferase
MIINSFNLIDGVNGLAALLSVISCTFFGLIFYYTNEISYAILSFSIVGALIGFLVFNWTPAKIFMGDTGSLFLGLVNAILVIKFTNVGDINVASINISQSALVGLAVLFIPLSDTLRVFVIRILSGKSPFYSDVNHIHHLLLRRGLSHSQVTLCLSILAIGYIVLAINIQTLGINTAVLILFIIGFLIPLLIDKTSYKRIRTKSNVNNEENIQTDITTTFISTPINTSELNN